MGYAAEALIGQQLSCATARANDGGNKQRISTKATRSIMGFPNVRPSAATCEPAMARQRVGLGAADQHRRGSPRTDLFNGETKAKGYYVADGAGPYLQVSAQRQQVMGVPVQARRQGPRHGPRHLTGCRSAGVPSPSSRTVVRAASHQSKSLVCRVPFTREVQTFPNGTLLFDHCSKFGFEAVVSTPGVTLFGRAEPQLGQDEVPGLDAHQCRALAYWRRPHGAASGPSKP